MRKAVVLDKSGTIIDPCRILLDLRSGEYTKCESTLQYAENRCEMLVNVMGPFKSIMEGKPKGLTLKVSYQPLPDMPLPKPGILEREGVLAGLKGVTERVMSDCNTQMGICRALMINQAGDATHAVGLGGRLYADVEPVVRSIIASGSDVFLATGNCRESALKCAALLGVPKMFVLADADPDDKRKLIRKLRGFYGVVVMVGNDLNDLSAMEEADIAVMVEREGAKETGISADLLKRDRIDYVVPSFKEVWEILSKV